MPKIKVHELAKKLDIRAKELINVLSEMGISGKTPLSSLESDIAEKAEKHFKKKTPAETASLKTKQPAAKTEKRKAPEKPDETKKTEKHPTAAKEKIKAEHKKTKTAKVEKIQKQEKQTVEQQTSAAEHIEPVSEKPSAVIKKPAKEPEEETLRKEIPPKTEKLTEEATAAKPIIESETIKLPEEEVISKVPDKFLKGIETETVEKLKGKPQMQRAFQAIRKIDTKKWHDTKHFKPQVKDKFAPKKEEQKPQAASIITRKKTLKLREGATVKEFAELISVKISDVIKKFMDLGYMPTINQPVDIDAALLVAEGFGAKVEVTGTEEEFIQEITEDNQGKLQHRPPVVTIMGHVDHGKTSLLDAIRETKVTETEAGGITQHIGAYKITLKGKDIVFLDTPGHEAFTAMRARGAKVTDIVVLVVAADDGVMPQTIEAIDHSKAANVPIIVAVNKVDKPEANLQKVKNELAEHGLLSEEWGGQNIFAEVSAKKRIGIEHLLEMILLQAEIMELKANPDKLAKGTIVEAKIDRGRGPVATVLVQSGTLTIGDAFLAGTSVGKVRALIDDNGKRIQKAGPSTPVEVIGFSEVPSAGDVFTAVEDEKRARQIALNRQQKEKAAQMAKDRKLTLDDLYAKIKEGEIKELNIVIKGDVQGSIEAIQDAFEHLTHPQVKVKVIHSSAGGINESDVMLASASNAIIIGFNVHPESKASQLAEKEGVDIRLYNIIYNAIEDVKKALEGMLEPTLKEKVLGRAEVRQTFQVSRIGTIAGCYVVDGTINRASDGIRVLRDNVVIYTGKISSLKRFKEDVKSVQSGYECGITIENYNDMKTGDILENYIIEKIAAKF